MSTLDNIALAIKKEISDLTKSTNGKKNIIDKAYTAVVNKANDDKKAELKKLDDDTAKIKKLKKMYQSHTNEAYEDEDSDVVTPVKSTSTKEPKDYTSITKYEDAITSKEKAYYGLSQIKKGTKAEISEYLLGIDSTINAKTIELEVANLEKAGAISKVGKTGKQLIYSI